jgi:hypothetical protein
LPDQRRKSNIVPIYEKAHTTDCNKYSEISLLSTLNKILTNALSKLNLCIDEVIGVISVGVDVTDQILIRFLAFIRYWTKKSVYTETVYKLFIDPKKPMIQLGWKCN